MELWIRSQDRKKIINVDEVKIETVKDGNTFIYSHATDLGTYKTKARALEVLDEIQEFIENMGKIKITQDINGITSEVEEAKRVYQMPLE